MKTARSGESLKSWTRKLLRDVGEVAFEPMDPRRAVVFAVLSADLPESRAEEALKVIEAEFVDFNELRVATELELKSMLGPKYPDIERRVVRMLAILNGIFDKEGTLTFDRVKTLPKKEVRAFLSSLPEMTPYVEAFTMMYGLEGQAVPVDDELVAAMVEAGVVDEGTSAAEVQRQLEAAAKPEDYHALHVAARRLLGERNRKRRG